MIDSLIAQQPMGHGLQSAASHSTLSDAHVGNSHAAAESARVSNAPSGHDTSQTNGPRSQAKGDGNGNGNGNGDGRRIASLPPGDPLAQLLSEGLALKQMAEQARRRTAVPIRPAPANACLKPNLHSAFVTALLLSDRVMPHVDIRR